MSESLNEEEAKVSKKRGVEEDAECLQNMWERDAECINDTAYGTATWRQEREVYSGRREQERGIYRIPDIRRGAFNECPVEGCEGGGRDKFGMYRHFCLRHPGADVIIESDGELPKCEECGMRVRDLDKHMSSGTCRKGRKRRENERKQEMQAVADEVGFEVNGKALERVKQFR